MVLSWWMVLTNSTVLRSLVKSLVGSHAKSLVKSLCWKFYQKVLVNILRK
ncbi:hypothetical protein HMPREF3230_01113 [Gardnerella vaginalis]|uniref:Uncharacterized protein n=1 Tax=Gardnerella vaginalis TaxID=2702 RepID=A0A135Z3S6_GARVA|nr:hypothetical protein HMPREF3230_01113 [Gardnerella vaginalis]